MKNFRRVATSVLVLIYYSVILVLQAGVTALTGDENSPLITVVSTLAIAALFNPLRLRIQRTVDKRFYRSNYNAEVVLQRFSEHARENVDLSGISSALIEAAEETLQPEKISLLLKKRRGVRRE